MERLLRDCAFEFDFTFEFHDLGAVVNPVVGGDSSARFDPGEEHCCRFTQLFRSGLATTPSADLSMVLPFPSCPIVSYWPVGDDLLSSYPTTTAFFVRAGLCGIRAFLIAP
jgi:hypothetical protein